MESLSIHGVDPPLPPIEQSLQAPAGSSSFSWGLLVLVAAFALAARYLGPIWLRVFEATGIRTLEDWTMLLAALLAAIVIHEAGHLSAALALDFDVLGGSLGPVRLIRMHRSWSIQLSWNLFSGSVIAIPRKQSNWRTRMLTVVAAGPLATLFSGFFAALLVLRSGAPDDLLTRFLAGLVELNFFIFVFGLIPNSPASRLANDARLFYSFLRVTSEANQILLYHMVTQLQIAGLRPRDYPERVVRKLATARGRAEMCSVYASAIALWAIDRGDIPSADAWDKRALDLSDFCAIKRQNSALAASACFDVIFRDDIRAARGKFAEVQLSILSPLWLRYRIAAAYWIAARNVPAALAEIARARYSFPNRLPYYEFERTLLATLHRKAITMQPDELQPQVA